MITAKERLKVNGASKTGRTRSLFAAVVAAGSLVLAQVAWACTAQPRIINLLPITARPGQQIAVSGQGVSPELAPNEVGRIGRGGAISQTVEIRWNGITGPSLATVPIDDRGNFSTQVIVPQAPPGIYTVVVAAGESGIARAALEVIPTSNGSPKAETATAKGASADLWEGFRTKTPADAQPAGAVSGEPPWGLTAGIGMTIAGAAMALVGAFAVFGSKKRSRSSPLR